MLLEIERRAWCVFAVRAGPKTPNEQMKTFPANDGLQIALSRGDKAVVTSNTALQRLPSSGQRLAPYVQAATQFTLASELDIYSLVKAETYQVQGLLDSGDLLLCHCVLSWYE